MHHSLLASKAPPMTSSKLWRSQSSPSSHVLRIAFLCARASVRQCTEGVISCVLTSIVFWDHTFVVKKGSDKSACAGVIHNLRTHHHPHNISLNWTEESSWLPRDHKKKPSPWKLLLRSETLQNQTFQSSHALRVACLCTLVGYQTVCERIVCHNLTRQTCVWKLHSCSQEERDSWNSMSRGHPDPSHHHRA